MCCRCALAASRKSAKVRKINRHIYILRAFDVREEQARKNYATYIHHGTVISVVTDQLSEPIVYVSLNCAIVWYYSYSNLSFGYIYLKLLEFCDFSTCDFFTRFDYYRYEIKTVFIIWIDFSISAKYDRLSNITQMFQFCRIFSNTCRSDIEKETIVFFLMKRDEIVSHCDLQRPYLLLDLVVLRQMIIKSCIIILLCQYKWYLHFSWTITI